MSLKFTVDYMVPVTQSLITDWAAFLTDFTCCIFQPYSSLYPYPSLSGWQPNFSSQSWSSLSWVLPITSFAHSDSFYCGCCVGVSCHLARSVSPGDTNLLEEPALPGYRLLPISPSSLTVCIAWVSSQKLLKKSDSHRIGVEVLLLVKSWLRNKKQEVVFNGHFSGWGEASSVDQCT